MATTVPVKEDMLIWALSRAGYGVSEFTLKYPLLKIDKWLSGDKFPTIKQLESFSKKVHVPFGYLLLSQPPDEKIDFPFFRTGSRKPAYTVSPNVYDTILDLMRRQDWLREYLLQLDAEPLDYVGKFNSKIRVDEFVEDLRRTLKLEVGWTRGYKTWEDTLSVLIDAIEEIGIIVIQNGIVGNNTRRPIPVDECRGFVLVDEYVPFMYLNNADAKAAQLFTLVHELAHIWLNKSAGFNQKKLLPADDPIEVLCDRVAAEFLVPAHLLEDAWTQAADIKKLAARFKVSPIVIARRAMDLRLLSKSDFFSFYNHYMEGVKRRKEHAESGGDFYLTAKRRVSPTFAGYVDSAVKTGQLTYKDAFRLTGLYGDTYTRFVNEKVSRA